MDGCEQAGIFEIEAKGPEQLLIQSYSRKEESDLDILPFGIYSLGLFHAILIYSGLNIMLDAAFKRSLYPTQYTHPIYHRIAASTTSPQRLLPASH